MIANIIEESYQNKNKPKKVINIHCVKYSLLHIIIHPNFDIIIMPTL